MRTIDCREKPPTYVVQPERRTCSICHLTKDLDPDDRECPECRRKLERLDQIKKVANWTPAPAGATEPWKLTFDAERNKWILTTPEDFGGTPNRNNNGIDLSEMRSAMDRYFHAMLNPHTRESEAEAGLRAQAEQELMDGLGRLERQEFQLRPLLMSEQTLRGFGVSPIEAMLRAAGRQAAEEADRRIISMVATPPVTPEHVNVEIHPIDAVQYDHEEDVDDDDFDDFDAPEDE